LVGREIAHGAVDDVFNTTLILAERFYGDSFK